MRLRSSRAGPIRGLPAIPSDKSLSHRALILGALAEGETRITGLLQSADVMATVAALRAFGIGVDNRAGKWAVTGGKWRSPVVPVDCGNSGSAARLLMGAAAGFDLTATFTGDESLRRRPMRRVTEPLARMGARIDGGDRLPITIHGGELTAIRHVNEPASAQVKTAILLAGLRASGETVIEEPVPSRDHGEIMLRQFGATVKMERGRVSLNGLQSLVGQALTIPADPSSAAFAWLTAAIIPGSEVTVRDVLLNPLRVGFVVALQRMGGDVAMDNVRGRNGETIGDVRVRYSPLFGAEFTSTEIPSMIDEIPALAVAAALARGETVIEGLGELRHKESDRLAGIAAGLGTCGVETSIEGDALRIAGGKPRGGEVETHGDHRLAMAFAVLGLAAERPVTVGGAEMIATSFPGFAQTMRSIGAHIDELE
ncbi:MAG TPA: 3-phosphoshikimate 1-carboxyvinyltransferase [Sphingomicrobium sp.]|nr:3-phosphoshikimate 1-carboxyvinyltransferase [Sphingomicrobium sp.]